MGKYVRPMENSFLLQENDLRLVELSTSNRSIIWWRYDGFIMVLWWYHDGVVMIFSRFWCFYDDRFLSSNKGMQSWASWLTRQHIDLPTTMGLGRVGTSMVMRSNTVWWNQSLSGYIADFWNGSVRDPKPNSATASLLFLLLMELITISLWW